MNNKGRIAADSSYHFEIVEETIAADYQQADMKHFHKENSGRMVAEKNSSSFSRRLNHEVQFSLQIKCQHFKSKTWIDESKRRPRRRPRQGPRRRPVDGSSRDGGGGGGRDGSDLEPRRQQRRRPRRRQKERSRWRQKGP
jgi:hypothetical protein